MSFDIAFWYINIIMVIGYQVIEQMNEMQMSFTTGFLYKINTFGLFSHRDTTF